jgi:GMP synthase (glutamine-hydrolysing)
VKPFLLLGTRAEDAAADNEYEAFVAFTGLPE